MARARSLRSGGQFGSITDFHGGRSLRIAEPIKPVSGAFTKQRVLLLGEVIVPISDHAFTEKRLTILFPRTPSPAPLVEGGFRPTMREYARVGVDTEKMEKASKSVFGVFHQIFVADPADAFRMCINQFLAFGKMARPPLSKSSHMGCQRAPVQWRPLVEA